MMLVALIVRGFVYVCARMNKLFSVSKSCAAKLTVLIWLVTVFNMSVSPLHMGAS